MGENKKEGEVPVLFGATDAQTWLMGPGASISGSIVCQTNMSVGHGEVVSRARFADVRGRGRGRLDLATGERH